VTERRFFILPLTEPFRIWYKLILTEFVILLFCKTQTEQNQLWRCKVSYEIVVLAKQVPDTHNITGQAMKEDGTVNRAALPAIFNPEDLNALEEALKIKETHGGKITVITMGPPNAAQLLRDSLFRGADEVILVTDRAFAGADTLATSYALSMAVKSRENSTSSSADARQSTAIPPRLAPRRQRNSRLTRFPASTRSWNSRTTP